MRQRPGHVHRRLPGTRHDRWALGSGSTVAVLAVVLATCAGCTSGGSTTAATTPTAAATTPAAAAAGGVPLQQDYVNTIRRVLPSVVEIKTASGLGSGVVYDTAGHIVTNAHVVGTATSFQVLLAGSASPLPAKLTGSYPPDDLAVIQVTGRPTWCQPGSPTPPNCRSATSCSPWATR
jgi:putative serine protease PepD